MTRSHGWPWSDEYVSGSYSYQNFEGGRLRRPTAGGSVVWVSP